MQKFGLLFLITSTALLGLVTPVGGKALKGRETNAGRFARGLPPLPPRAPSKPEIAERARPPKREPMPVIEGRPYPLPSKRAPVPSGVKRGDSPQVEKRARPSKRADTPTVEKRAGPSKPADTPTVEKRTSPSKRANTPTVEKRARPSKRAKTPTVEKRAIPSKRAETEVFDTPYWQLTFGRLEVRWACNDSIVGYVANNPSGGSFGLNDAMLPGEDDLYVEYFDSNLMVMNPDFPPPYFVGGGDVVSSVHDCSNKIPFGTVELGSYSAVWTLDPMCGALNATLINQDDSEDEPSLVYDPAYNVLSFTHDINRISMTEYPVYIFLSD